MSEKPRKGGGEPAAVVLRYTVYEGEVMAGWSEAEIEKYHDADQEACEEFCSQAIAMVRRGQGSAPDIEVFVEGNKMGGNV